MSKMRQEAEAEAVTNVVDNATSKNGAVQKGWKGNRPFGNDGRNGGEILPETDANGNPIKYKEYDVWPNVPGYNRGTERVVIGTDANGTTVGAYYTNNHYENFVPIKCTK